MSRLNSIVCLNMMMRVAHMVFNSILKLYKNDAQKSALTFFKHLYSVFFKWNISKNVVCYIISELLF